MNTQNATAVLTKRANQREPIRRRWFYNRRHGNSVIVTQISGFHGMRSLPDRRHIAVSYHFAKKSIFLFCKNVYLLTKKSKQRLVANIAQTQRYVNIKFCELFRLF